MVRLDERYSVGGLIAAGITLVLAIPGLIRAEAFFVAQSVGMLILAGALVWRALRSPLGWGRGLAAWVGGVAGAHVIAALLSGSDPLFSRSDPSEGLPVVPAVLGLFVAFLLLWFGLRRSAGAEPSTLSTPSSGAPVGTDVASCHRAELEFQCIQEVTQDSVDAYRTRMTTKYRQFSAPVTIGQQRSETVTCPFCHATIALTHYPSLSVREAVRKEGTTLIVGLVAAASLIVLMALAPNGGVGHAKLLAFVVAAVALALSIRKFAVDTQDAIRIGDENVVWTQGEGAVLGPAVNMLQKKHRVSSGFDIHVGISEYEARRRMRYYQQPGVQGP